MSKKIKTDAPIEFEKDKRGLREIPDTIRRHARMSKRQIRWSLIIAGLLLVLLAAIMVITNNLATAPLEAYESAEIMKEAAGAEYVDIINKSTSIKLRPSESGEPVMLNGRRLILLRRSGVTADDYWFTVLQKGHIDRIQGLKQNDTKSLDEGTADIIALDSEGNNVLFVFKAKQVDIDNTIRDWPDNLGYTPEFISYNSQSADFFTGDGSSADVDESNEYSVLLHRMLSKFTFIQYTLNGASGQINIFRGTDVDLKKADDNLARLQIIRIVFIVLLIAALGVLAYTLKSKKILSREPVKQRMIRLAVLGVTAALTGCLVFLTIQISNQNDAMIRINPRSFDYTVDEVEKTMTVVNDFDTFASEMEGKPVNEVVPSGFDELTKTIQYDDNPLLVDINAVKAYIEKSESERDDADGPEDDSLISETDSSGSQTKGISGLADGIISFYYETSDTDIIWTPLIQEDMVTKTEGLNESPSVLRKKSGDSVSSTVTTFMHATAEDAGIPGSNIIWRILYYAALVLIVALFVGLLYYFRYERDLGFPIINTVILIVLMIVTLYPVLNTVAYSFSSGNAASRGRIGLLPQEFTTKSYTDIMDNYMLGAGWISVAKTIITTLLNLFWTGMLAFTLTRKEYVLGRPITLIMVLTMYVNAGLIPNFLLISQTLGLKNTFWVYIIPTMYSCFNMIIIRTYIASLPGELVESARIDGAGDIRIYWQIIFPLCAPVLATVALFIAVGSWNSWFDTMLYNDSVKRLHTLQYVLKGKIATAGATASLAQNSTAAATDLAKTTVNSRTVQCATTVVTALPILVVYPFLQKYFVTGMALGSVKG